MEGFFVTVNYFPDTINGSAANGCFEWYICGRLKFVFKGELVGNFKLAAP